MHKSLLFLQSGGVLDRGSIPLISTKKTFQPFARNIIFAESSKISSAKKAEKMQKSVFLMGMHWLRQGA